MRGVLQHECCPPGADGLPLDSGLPFRCSCGVRIARRKAEALIENGDAFWKKQRCLNGGVKIIHSEIVLRKYSPSHHANARTIDVAAIERAYVLGNHYERRRIDLYQEIRGAKCQRS